MTCRPIKIYVSHHGKGMRDLSIRWEFGSEAVSGEEFVTVIVLDDFPHGFEGHGVRVQLVRVHVVERRRL